MAHSVLGLDIGTKYVKYVELAHRGKGRFDLLSVGMAPTTSKGLSSDAKVDQETLALSIHKLIKDGHVKTKSVVVALPEGKVFTRIIQVPPLSERELAGSIKWEAEQYIPLPLSEVHMDFSIVGESKDADGNRKLDILLVAAPMNVIERYKAILNMAEVEPEAMETEIISASRALLPAVQPEGKPLTVMVVNLGAFSTDFSILRNGVIAFTRSLPTGGDSFTRVLSQDFNIPPGQAEEFKKTYGLRKEQLEGKVYRSLKPIFSVISEEIKRSVTYFQNKFTDEYVSSIILSGGSAKLPGLVEALVETVGIETQIGNPWANVNKDPVRFKRLEEEGPTFAVAIGLAMRTE